MSNSEKNLLPPLWHRKWYIMIVGINSRRLWQPCWKFMKRYGFVKYRLFAQNLVFAWLLKTKPDLTLVGRRLAMRLLRHLLACNHIIHIIRIKCKKTYQFTTPCKSDEVTHPKQHKSFFSGIMWQHDLIALTIHLTWLHLTFVLPHYHVSKETEIMQTLQRL